MIIPEDALAANSFLMPPLKIDEARLGEIFDGVEVKKGAIASVRVLAPFCVYADALATSLMLFEDGEAAEAWSKNFTVAHPGIKIWLYYGQ